MITVMATRPGQYGGALRDVGEKFTIKDKDELGSWMEETEGSETETGDKIFAVHRGQGSWDVCHPNGDVVDNGGGLKKAKALALVEELNNLPDDSDDGDDN